MVFVFKQKTAYEVRISDWSSDVCSSDLGVGRRIGETHLDALGLRVVAVGDAAGGRAVARRVGEQHRRLEAGNQALVAVGRGVGEGVQRLGVLDDRSEEHTSELQSLMRISYAVFCLKKKKEQHNKTL